MTGKKPFTNTGGTGSVSAGPVTLGAPTTEFRFYPSLKRPEQVVDGTTMHSFWNPIGSFDAGPQPYQEVLTTHTMQRSKVNGGILTFALSGAQFDDATLPNPYRSFGIRFVSEPCAAQTLFGTATIVMCHHGPTQGLCAMSATCVVISADGQTKTEAGSVQGGGLALNAFNLFRTAVVNLASVAVEEGGRVAIEVGATYADFDGTVNEATRHRFGTQATWEGAAFDDGVDGATDGTTKTGHITFSNGVTVRPTTWTAGNDTPGGAINLGSSAPVHFGPLDVSKSPGFSVGSQGLDPNLSNAAYFQWTAPETGRVFLDTRGSNYYTNIDVFSSQAQTTSFPDVSSSSRTPFAGRNWDSLAWDAVAGQTYWIGIFQHARLDGSSQSIFAASGGGGSLSLNIFYRQAPLTDDLYIAGKAIYVYRKNGSWGEVNHNNNLTAGFIPTGMAFDYARSGVVDQNVGGSPPSPEPRVDLLISSLFNFTLLEAFNAVTLNDSQSEYNYHDMTFGTGGPGMPMPSATFGGNQKIIPMADKNGNRVQGIAIVGTEGDNYNFYGGLSSPTGAGFWVIEMVPDWWSGSLPNFATRILEYHSVALENQSTDHFDIMPDGDTILYTSAGQRVMRYRMSDQTQLSDFVSVPSSDSARPGARGVRINTSQEVFVAIGSKVHHYSAAGALIKTMQSNDPARHGSLERMAWRSDGRTLMVVDVTHSDILEFDTISGAHVDTIETNLPIGNVCGIACFRGFESGGPPPPPPDPPPGEPPNTGEPPSEGTGTTLPIRQQRAAPHINEEKYWKYYSRFQLDLETGVGLPDVLTGLGLGDDPQIMLDWSDDGGHSWRPERWQSAGTAGQTNRRALWRRLGRSRDRVFRITVSDPVKWAFVDAYLSGKGGTS